jgi:hypothetical protein
MVAFISSGFALVGTLAGLIVPRLHKQSRQLDAAVEQLANSHGTNLRDDLDFIRDVVLDVRADMSWVRRDHIDLTKRVDLLEEHA